MSAAWPRLLLCIQRPGTRFLSTGAVVRAAVCRTFQVPAEVQPLCAECHLQQQRSVSLRQLKQTLIFVEDARLLEQMQNSAFIPFYIIIIIFPFPVSSVLRICIKFLRFSVVF